MSTAGAREFEAYFIAGLIAFITVLGSLGSALILNIGDPLIGRPLGAAWAWGIGAGTVLWWLPWAKQAIPAVEVDR